MQKRVAFDKAINCPVFPYYLSCLLGLNELFPNRWLSTRN